MRQFFGMSQSGNLEEAVRGLKDPQLIMLLSNNEQFESHVKKLESLFPHVPSIGCIGMSYDTRIVEKGVGIIAYYGGINAVANVLEEVSVMPVKYIGRLKQDIHTIKSSGRDTVCIDFCWKRRLCTDNHLQRITARRHFPCRRNGRRRKGIGKRQGL